MRTYAILRDLTRPSTAGPFEARTGLRTAEEPGRPQVDVAELRKRDLADVVHDPEVRAVAPVMPTRLVAPVDVAGTGEATAAWGIGAIGADTTTRTGTGVVAAVLDTGIDGTHPAFAGMTLVEQDFSGSGNGDKQGHGTHCAGTVFGRAVDGTRIGVAPGVEKALIGKVLGDDGSGDSDMIFRGIQWAVTEGAHVLSMSLGFDFPGLVQQLTANGWPADLATSAALEAYRANLRMFDALMEVVRSRDAFGTSTVVCAAAGNESHRDVDPDYEISVSIPAAADGVVSVGALGQSPAGLTVAPFSNTMPQVSAPGVDVLSARAGGGLRSLNGTSMATPHVAGTAALWWEEILASPLPTTSAGIVAKLLGTAALTGFAPGTDTADRGFGLVRVP
jgi:subtilisin family serine protease